VTTLQDDDSSERTIFISRKRGPDAAQQSEAIGHYLVVLEGTSPGKRLELASEPITIGRGSKSTLVVDDHDVSRLHARVTLVNGTAFLEDMQSTNGTFVDGEQVSSGVVLKDGARLQMGGQTIKYERRSQADVKKAQELERDIKKATQYVHSLLPTPLDSGAVLTAWRFVPSAQLGGDAFGYYWLDADTFVFYLVDVSGHGVGAAMHSVSVLNVLRQRALPQVDFRNPAEVLASLNARFQSDNHGGLYFTMWYGVYHARDRKLVHGSAGHGPAFLVPTDRSEAQPVGEPAVMIGLLSDQSYESQVMAIPPGSTLYVFSDGAYEVFTKDQGQWELSNFLPLLTEPAVPGMTDPDRIYQAVKQVAKAGPLDDDFSLMALIFP
jgi:serine phosphatase RsbU (regulator of sigma subunit)